MTSAVLSRPSRSSIDSALSELAAALGNRLVMSQAVRAQHINVTTWSAGGHPDGVVFPQSTAEIQSAARICARHGMPIIPFGAGSSLEGHLNAPFGGISFDMRDMNRIIAVHPEDADCIVEAGVTRQQLNVHLRDQGLFFPIDPGADAHLGGMAATRASGTTAVRYGTMKDAVLAMTVVLPSGELMVTSRRARKSSAGYRTDLEAAPDPRRDRWRGCTLSKHQGRLRCRDHGHPVGNTAGARRTRRRAADRHLQCLFETRPCRGAHPVP
jgi:D-lactate dehydrogenase (cytochrome)